MSQGTQRGAGSAGRKAGVIVAGVLALRGLVACVYPTDGYREAGRQLMFPTSPASSGDSGDDGGGDDSSNPPDNNPPPVDAGSDKG